MDQCIKQCKEYKYRKFAGNSWEQFNTFDDSAKCNKGVSKNLVKFIEKNKRQALIIATIEKLCQEVKEIKMLK